MSARTVALVGALCYEHRELIPLLEEHLEDNDGEVLAHLVMSDVVRWLVEHRDERDRCQAVWSWLERAFQRGDDLEKDLIAVSGVEMIPAPGQPGEEFRDMLGPMLRAVDPWRA